MVRAISLSSPMNKMLLPLVLVVIVLAGGYAAYQTKRSSDSAVATTTSSPTTTSTSTGSVVISNFAFGPSTLTVKRGAAITWTNNDTVAHTVTSEGGPVGFDSGTLNAGGSFTFMFTDAGTYTYHCSLHSGMAGSIVVTE
jgi:plastocyanin